MTTSLDLRTGGPAEAVRLLGKIHVADGHTVEAVCADAPDLATDAFPFPVHCLGPSTLGYGYTRALKTWLEANRSRFDAVLVHGLWQYPVQAAYEILRSHVPYFVYPHGMLDPWFNELFPLKHLKKVVYWHLIGRKSLDSAASLIFTTDEELRRSARAFFPYQWHALIAPLGVEGPPEMNATAILSDHWPDFVDKTYLLFLGRLHPKKGCDLLLRAFAKQERNTSKLLVMAGPGESSYIQELKQLAEELEIANRIRWVGMVTGTAKWALLGKAEAFILPSHQENFAVAVAEALSVGTPVLISNKVQIFQQVVTAGAGLAESDTEEGTGALLQRWNLMSQEERLAMRAKAEACFKQSFIAEIAARQLLEQISSRMRSLRDKEPRIRLEPVQARQT